MNVGCQYMMDGSKNSPFRYSIAPIVLAFDEQWPLSVCASVASSAKWLVVNGRQHHRSADHCIPSARASKLYQYGRRENRARFLSVFAAAQEEIHPLLTCCIIVGQLLNKGVMKRCWSSDCVSGYASSTGTLTRVTC